MKKFVRIAAVTAAILTALGTAPAANDVNVVDIAVLLDT